MRTHRPKKMRINNVGISISMSMNTTTMHTSRAHATTITALQQGKRPKRRKLLPAVAAANKTPQQQKTATKAADTSTGINTHTQSTVLALMMCIRTTAATQHTTTHTALAAPALPQKPPQKRKPPQPAVAAANKTPLPQKTATKAAGTPIMTMTTATSTTITVTRTALAATTTAPPCKSSIARKHLLQGNGFASWKWIAP